MATKRFYILLFCCLAGLTRLAAQIPDTVDVNSTYYRTFTEDDLFAGFGVRYRPLDTLITDYHIYNPVTRKYNLNTTFGNLGQPYRNPYGTPYRKLGFDLGINQLNIWEQTKENALFYRSRAPFIEVSYVNGSKKEQNFFINLNQNITKGWNVGLRYERQTSRGFYFNNYTDNTNWLLYSSYLSKNERYRFAFSGERNNISARVNGGLNNVDDFKNNIENNRLLLDVNLTGAKNVWRKRFAHFQQSFDLARKEPLPDSVLAKQSIVRKFNSNVVRLYHVFDLEDMALQYNDTLFSADSFYVAPLFDSTGTHDRTNNTLIENRLGIKFMREHAQNGIFVIDAFAGHQYIHYNTTTWEQPASTVINGKSNNIYVGGNIRLPAFKSWSFNGSATIYLLGYNIGDYQGDFSISRTGKDTLGNTRNKIEAGLLVKAYRPNYLQSNYVSNYFVWNNDFKKTFANTLYATYTNHRLKFDASAWLTDMRQYVYYDENAHPDQANQGVTIFAARFTKRFTLGNKWHFDEYVTGQYVTSNLLPLPNLTLRSSMYYQNYVFKKALLLAVGFDVFFNTAYKAPNYMPATGVFYIQNQTKVGNYPYVDVFIDAQIKKARIFLKIEHVTSGLLGQNYLQYPGYPQNDRAFKFGINWRFFN